MNHILHQKREPIFLITKSLNQYTNINPQTSDEIEPLENYENNTVAFDHMLLSEQIAILNSFVLEGVTMKLIYSTYLKDIFIYQKILFVIILI